MPIREAALGLLELLALLGSGVSSATHRRAAYTVGYIRPNTQYLPLLVAMSFQFHEPVTVQDDETVPRRYMISFCDVMRPKLQLDVALAQLDTQ